LRHIGINPSRLALIEVLQQMGGDVTIVDERLAHGEPVADLIARTSSSARRSRTERSGDRQPDRRDPDSGRDRNPARWDC
jgi:antitoxin (DNA-binding transcriptional repressor) of toxin-antitoxin stability system